ncbi:MAG: adenylyl-sulfate kinase, partial [Gammaproteobacteria bacterium]
MIIWLIGVSGAGKTTVGRMLCERMRATGKHVLLLDGDRLRDVWNDDLGHEMSARRRNHTRISKLCALLDQDPSIDLVVPALSIFPDLRAWNRQHFSRYVEVFLDLPMEEAIRRDRKGIY